MTFAQASYARWWLARGQTIDWIVDTCPYGKPWLDEDRQALREYALDLEAEMKGEVRT